MFHYQSYNQFQKSKRTRTMMLNYLNTNPTPYFFYFLCPTHDLPSLIPHEQPLPNSPAIKEENSSQIPLDDEKIMVTRQDLVKEGYEQTKKPWTEEEDRLLLRLCKNQNARFEEIAAQIQGRNAKMCYSRYRRLAYQTRINWNKTQDQKLVALVRELGQEQWKLISTHFQGRTPKQIKDHYQNYLKTDLNRNDWTLEEDLELIRLINLNGKNWKAIEEGLTGRSKNQIKNRFFGKITRLNNKKRSLIDTEIL